MITAIYFENKPTSGQLSITHQIAQTSQTISNSPSICNTTHYKFGKGKASARIWGTKEKYLSTKDFPFNWLLPYAKPCALIATLAKDADRIALFFHEEQAIPPIYLFMAYAFNSRVRIFKGTKTIDFDKAQLATLAKQAYSELILPQIKPIKAPTDCLSTPNGGKLRPYQQQMVNFALSKPFTGLLVDMGLGKTLATLATINEWIKKEEIDPTKPILIVAPIMVALDTWSREVEKWGYDWDVKINIRPTAKKREKMLESLLQPQEKPTLFITNPQQLEPIYKYFYGKNIALPFEVLIIDELSTFKSPTTKKNSHLAHFRQRVKKFIGLTGTPSPNHLLEVWNQVKIIDKNNSEWAKSTYEKFKDTYFIPIENRYNPRQKKWLIKEGADDVIYAHLSKHAISMQTEGLVSLPEVSFVDKMITLPKKAQETYNTFINELKTTLETGQSVTYKSEQGNDIFIPTSDTLRTKCSQLANGHIYTNQELEIIHEEKLLALEELIETATSPLLVFYYFQSDLERIQSYFKKKFPVLDSKDKNIQSVIRKWNNKEIPVLLGHPASVGHGLNLQDGGHTIIWFSLPNWNNDQYQQANKRLHRSGQKNCVSIVHLITKGTIDEIMLQKIREKAKGNNKLMAALDTMERT